jgi:hypothetical protein
MMPEKKLKDFKEKSINLMLDFFKYIKYSYFMRKKRTKMGRPPLTAKDRRTALVTMRLKPNEHKQLLQDAKDEGMSLSAYLLDCWQKARD